MIFFFLELLKLFIILWAALTCGRVSGAFVFVFFFVHFLSLLGAGHVSLAKGI